MCLKQRILFFVNIFYIKYTLNLHYGGATNQKADFCGSETQLQKLSSSVVTKLLCKNQSRKEFTVIPNDNSFKKLAVTVIIVFMLEALSLIVMY